MGCQYNNLLTTSKLIKVNIEIKKNIFNKVFKNFTH